MHYLYLIGGFILLLIAGDLLVRGAVSLAEKFGIPSLIIGLTVVAFGTSAPELVISLDAALNGFGGISIGNVVGSNIANILIVLGMPAIIRAIPCGGIGATRSAVFMMAVTVVFIVLVLHQPLTWAHAVILLALLTIFLTDSVFTARRAKAAGEEVEDPLEEVEGRPENQLVAFAFLIGGLIGLPIGGHFAIEGAIGIARHIGVSETAIGLTIIAFGTSLPELMTSLTAALRGHSAVAVGNVIGSNIFNILAILGATALVTPLHSPPRIADFDIWVMVASSLILMPFVFYCLPIKRTMGIFMVLAYACYIYLVFAKDTFLS